MEITEVRIKLMEESEDRLRAFCSITIDNSFVVRDLKIIEGTSGPFVAMPSRKLTERCNKCGYKNHLRSNYCNQCGIRLKGSHAVRSHDGDANANKLYADIAHPINQACRDIIQTAVITEYQTELERAKLPGYKSRYDDEYLESMKSDATDGASTPIVSDGNDNQPKPTDPSTWIRADLPDSNAPQPRQPHLDSTSEERSQEKSSNSDSSFGQGILE